MFSKGYDHQSDETCHRLDLLYERVPTNKGFLALIEFFHSNLEISELAKNYRFRKIPRKGHSVTKWSINRLLRLWKVCRRLKRRYTRKLTFIGDSFQVSSGWNEVLIRNLGMVYGWLYCGTYHFRFNLNVLRIFKMVQMILNTFSTSLVTCTIY